MAGLWHLYCIRDEDVGGIQHNGSWKVFSCCIVPGGGGGVAVWHWEVVVLYCVRVDVGKSRSRDVYLNRPVVLGKAQAG